MEDNPDHNLSINKLSVLSEIIDGDVVIINLDTGNYYSLVQSGAFIWQKIEENISVGQLTSYLMDLFEVTESELSKDLTQFIDQLQKENLVVFSQGNTNEPGPKENISKKQPYVSPFLESFTDMQDFLLVDPIHEVDEQGFPVINSKQD